MRKCSLLFPLFGGWTATILRGLTYPKILCMPEKEESKRENGDIAWRRSSLSGPGQQKSWHKGKTSGDAISKSLWTDCSGFRSPVWRDWLLINGWRQLGAFPSQPIRVWQHPFCEGLREVGNGTQVGLTCCVSIQGLHPLAVPIRRLLQMQPTNASFFSLFLEDGPLSSFVASHIPRVFTRPKKKKTREKMATSHGVDRHFLGPGRLKSWRKGKTSDDATRKCSKG